jgi:hypothetical protein
LLGWRAGESWLEEVRVPDNLPWERTGPYQQQIAAWCTLLDVELVELGLRALIQAKPTAPKAEQTDVDPNDRPENPLLALLDSDFIGSADSDPVDLPETWKSELTAILGAKHDHR